jgi:triphosphoribosyl-dephospho-CoA synthase
MPELQRRLLPRRSALASAVPLATRIGRLAIRSLYREVALAAKPGLVTPWGSGSHDDMDYATFMRSLHALRPYFPAIAACGSRAPGLRPVAATGHRCRSRHAAGDRRGEHAPRGHFQSWPAECGRRLACWRRVVKRASAMATCHLVRDQWGEAILSGLSGATEDAGLSHGLAVAQRYGAGGARREAAAGFPAAIEIGLPAYRAALLATGDAELAATQTLFALIAELEDTNLLWRAGPAGLDHARRSAGDFVAGRRGAGD